MKLTTHHLADPGAWQPSLDPAMDSASTLVLVFGATQFFERTAPLTELARLYPRSVLLGCSTAGEIMNTQVHDASLSVAVVRFEHTALRRASAAVREPVCAWPSSAAS